MAIFNEAYLEEAIGSIFSSHSALSADSYCGKEAYDKYVKKYDEFVQFLCNPHKLPKDLLWSGTINSICKIIGLDSDDFNEIVAENIKPMSSEFKEDKVKDEKFREEVFDKIGDKNYVLEEDSDRYIVYSVKEKKLFWIDTDNNKFGEFPKTYSPVDKGFSDALWDSPESKKSLLRLFKEYDSSKGYNLIK